MTEVDEFYAVKRMTTQHISMHEVLGRLILQERSYGVERVTFTGLRTSGFWAPYDSNISVVFFDAAPRSANSERFPVNGGAAKWMIRLGIALAAGESAGRSKDFEVSNLFGFQVRNAGFKRVNIDIRLNAGEIADQRISYSEAWRRVAYEMEELFQAVDAAGIQDNTANVVIDF